MPLAKCYSTAWFPPLFFLSFPLLFSSLLFSSCQGLSLSTVKRVDPYAILWRKRTCKPHGPTFVSSSTYSKLVEQASSELQPFCGSFFPPDHLADLVRASYSSCSTRISFSEYFLPSRSDKKRKLKETFPALRLLPQKLISPSCANFVANFHFF